LRSAQNLSDIFIVFVRPRLYLDTITENVVHLKAFSRSRICRALFDAVCFDAITENAVCLNVENQPVEKRQ
jgi:hypothetical protein